MGDADAADRWYAAAADELTAKEMRSYAWVEVRRGLLDLRRGRYEAAAGHYERAGRAEPGWWVVQDHVAELLGARGELDRALAGYEELAGRVARPELQQALGDLHAFAGRPDRARPWHERALAVYRASAGRGEVHYLHHLADLLADVAPGQEAVAWARRDLALRRGFGAHAGLAWALHRAGRPGEAARSMDEALASGARSGQLLARAAAIQEAAGRAGEGRRLRERALAYDPRLGDFRAHR
jgi:tetratricopeptide (TPR) repeat protein